MNHYRFTHFDEYEVEKRLDTTELHFKIIDIEKRTGGEATYDKKQTLELG